MEENAVYIHTVQYYETDKMGVAHHSNYIRWMEEARIDFLRQIGWDYPKLEEMGIVSPVIGVSCEFRHPTAFADRVAIRVFITEFRGVVLRFGYEMKKQDGTEVCTGTSAHAFLNAEGSPIRLKRDYPELFEALSQCAAAEKPQSES